MSEIIRVVEPPSLQGKRCAPVLSEDRLGHYAEFRAFFTRAFALDEVGLSKPGYVALASDRVYELVFIGRSGEAFPAGVEINAVVDALAVLDEQQVDDDLWAILRWMIDGVGAPWSLDALESTAKLFRVRG